jgi:hypothetical protein
LRVDCRTDQSRFIAALLFYRASEPSSHVYLFGTEASCHSNISYVGDNYHKCDFIH